MEYQGYKLFAEPSFLEGFARLFDPAGFLNVYNYSATPEEADNKALASDWIAIGNDMRKSVYEQKSSSKPTTKK